MGSSRCASSWPKWFVLALAITASQFAHPGPALAANECTCSGTPTVVQIDVWLDPGHDPTNAGNGGIDLNQATLPNEQHVTWEVTNDLSNVLLNAGYCALLTRVNFNSVYSPRQRACIASGSAFNDNGDQAIGQALVSIHTNSSPHADTLGTSTVYPSGKTCKRFANTLLDDQSFANDLQTAMAPQMRLAYVGACSALPCSRNKGICASRSPCSPKTLSMIEEARIPAVIVEVGYQTNACQECFMRVQPGAIAEAVGAGIYNTFITPTACLPPQGRTLTAQPAKSKTRSTSITGLPPPRGATSKRSGAVQSFSEGFEGASFPPTGWTIQTSGAPSAYTWARTTSSFYVASGASAAFVGGGYLSAKDELLIGPATILGAGDTGLQFSWVGNRVFAGEVDAQLLARPSAGGSWTTLWTLSAEPYGNEFTIKTATVSLAGFAGQSIQFAFRAVGTNGADFAVDDISIGGFQPIQPPANDHCANASPLPHGSFVVSSSTCRGTNDMDPSGPGNCIGYEMDSPDVFYLASASAGDTLEASVHSLWGAAVYVMNSCNGAPSNCLSGQYFEDGDLDPTIRVVFSQLTNYFLVVDGTSGSCGDFELTGRLTGSTVGVGPEQRGPSGLSVIPNPVISRSMIVGSFRSATDGQAELLIMDITGRRVVGRSLRASRGHVSWQWDRKSATGTRVRPGMYIVRLRLGDEALQSQVVVRD